MKKEIAVKRFGEYFCSNEHAQQYVTRKQEEEKARAEYDRQHPRRSGSC
ncbi:MAG TPA: hypothetical protein VJ771_05530 [Candidatus Nitrosotalea sp.]|nr:hypothetical protein [Candidatus Nitrosotalea sp.]